MESGLFLVSKALFRIWTPVRLRASEDNAAKIANKAALYPRSGLLGNHVAVRNRKPCGGGHAQGRKEIEEWPLDHPSQEKIKLTRFDSEYMIQIDQWRSPDS
jgi:hypothetical protein